MPEQVFNIGVIGATGVVGQEFLRVLEQRRFPVGELRPLASARSAGKQLDFAGKAYTVEQARDDSFAGLDFVLVSATDDVSRRFVPCIVEAGAIAIDDGGAFRMRDDVPLVIPEINGEDVEWHRGILTTPNCVVTPIVMALGLLHRHNPIKRIVVSSYQSITGAGTEAALELIDHVRYFAGREDFRPQGFGDIDRPTAAAQPHVVAFNAVPQVGSFRENGYTSEEEKLINETKKILHAPDIGITATCVRIPVFVGHAESMNVEFSRPISATEAREVIASTPGVALVDDPAEKSYPMPMDCAGRDEVFVGRVREDDSQPNTINLFACCDNLRKGAALNVVQIMEETVRRRRTPERSS
jgi:aspartate-semialdehyde dehydrogenase